MRVKYEVLCVYLTNLAVVKRQLGRERAQADPAARKISMTLVTGRVAVWEEIGRGEQAPRLHWTERFKQMTTTLEDKNVKTTPRLPVYPVY